MTLFKKLQGTMPVESNLLEELKEIGDEKAVNPPAMPKASKKETSTKTKTLPPLGFILLLDCVPERPEASAEILLFHDLIEPLAKQVAEENEVPHWGLVDFARGGPQLAAKLARMFEDELPTGILLADSAMSETRACRAVLKRAARVVIQAVR
jgi:hypothetical protein